MRTGRPAKTPRSDFGKRIKQLREAANLPQKEVATSLGISQPSYAAWERREVAVTASQLIQLADILRCDITEFFKDDTPKRGRGPTGRARKAFEQVSQLPRSKQGQIIELVEAMLFAQQERAKAKAS